LGNVVWVLTYKEKIGDVWLHKKESSAVSSSSKTRIQVCLMEKEESGSNQPSTSFSNKCQSYFHLFDAFQETHEKAKRLTFSNNLLKSENNWLKEKIKDLENDLPKSNADFENLELIYQNSSCRFQSIFLKFVNPIKRKFYIL